MVRNTLTTVERKSLTYDSRQKPKCSNYMLISKMFSSYPQLTAGDAIHPLQGGDDLA
jgi:hypothetical protein